MLSQAVVSAPPLAHSPRPSLLLFFETRWRSGFNWAGSRLLGPVHSAEVHIGEWASRQSHRAASRCGVVGAAANSSFDCAALHPWRLSTTRCFSAPQSFSFSKSRDSVWAVNIARTTARTSMVDLQLQEPSVPQCTPAQDKHFRSQGQPELVTASAHIRTHPHVSDRSASSSIKVPHI